MATLYNFDIVAGASHCVQAQAKDSSNNPVDLTNYYVRGGAKNKFSDNTYALNLNPIVFHATSGIVQFSISGFQTSGLKTNVIPYDVEATLTGISGDNTVLKILRGYISVYPEISNF